MAIFAKCDEEFEQGTTGTTQMVISDDEDRIKPADALIIDGNVENPTVEMYNATEESDVVLQETTMDEELDENGDPFYTKSIFIPEDQEIGEYNVVHRVTVGGEDYKRTVVVDVVEVADK